MPSAQEGEAPDAAKLARRWHEILGQARDEVAALPPERAGTCVLAAGGDLCRAPTSSLADLIARSDLLFHAGRIRGALPQLR